MALPLIALAFAGCTSVAQIEAKAIDTASKYAKFDLGCDSDMSASVVATQKTGFQVHVQVGVRGCDQSRVYDLACTSGPECTVDSAAEVKESDSSTTVKKK